jgi:hypothetical protein
VPTDDKRNEPESPLETQIASPGPTPTVPGPSQEWATSQDWLTDPIAEKEQGDWTRLGTIEGMKTRVKYRIHQVISVIVPLSIVIAFGLFWLAVLIYVWHMLSPWGWLAADRLRELHTLIFSGAVGAVVSQGVKRFLD